MTSELPTTEGAPAEPQPPQEVTTPPSPQGEPAPAPNQLEARIADLETQASAQQTNAVAKVASTPVGTNTSDIAKPVGEVKPVAPTGPVNAVVKPKVDVIWKVGDRIILSRAPPTGDVRFWNAAGTPTGGYMTVVPMVFGSALCMILFSLLTRPPSRATIDKYFSKAQPDSSGKPVRLPVISRA